MCDNPNCETDRSPLFFSAKHSDMLFLSMGSLDQDGYNPGGFNCGSGDYLKGMLCLDCGKIQGQFPVPDPLEEELEE
ncbi:hypothetical protein CMI47_10960 [Candidatus Pacearchaeota archaeon]|nr:hypothetical protein [Candidatus Pacearchaeota archaeon]